MNWRQDFIPGMVISRELLKEQILLNVSMKPCAVKPAREYTLNGTDLNVNRNAVAV